MELVIINLKEQYPELYTSDVLIEVTEAVVDTFKSFKKADKSEEKADRRHLILADIYEERVDRLLFHKAKQHFNNQLATFELLVSRDDLYAAMNSLPEVQCKRLYAHFILGISMVEIARHEGVSVAAVSKNLKQAKKNLKKFLKF